VHSTWRPDYLTTEHFPPFKNTKQIGSIPKSSTHRSYRTQPFNYVSISPSRTFSSWQSPQFDVDERVFPGVLNCPTAASSPCHFSDATFQVLPHGKPLYFFPQKLQRSLQKVAGWCCRSVLTRELCTSHNAANSLPLLRRCDRVSSEAEKEKTAEGSTGCYVKTRCSRRHSSWSLGAHSQWCVGS
jgi:hypothetical protein